MSIERDFSDFEAAIAKLSREYDVFLFGTHGRLPAEGRRQLEARARALSLLQIDSASERYRFNTLIGRYNAQLERWDRAVREKEEGRGRFSRGGPGGSPNAPPPASVQPPAGKLPLPEDSGDRKVFEQYLRAKKERGQEIGQLKFEKFQEQLTREREKLKERTGRSDWEFEVAIDAERVKLAVRPAGGKGV
jgi:hypothetical protein